MQSSRHHPIESEEEQRLRRIERNRPLGQLLDSWLEDDDETPEEQRRALEALMRGIDENRPADAKLFSEHLK